MVIQRDIKKIHFQNIRSIFSFTNKATRLGKLLVNNPTLVDPPWCKAYTFIAKMFEKTIQLWNRLEGFQRGIYSLKVPPEKGMKWAKTFKKKPDFNFYLHFFQYQELFLHKKIFMMKRVLHPLRPQQLMTPILKYPISATIIAGKNKSIIEFCTESTPHIKGWMGSTLFLWSINGLWRSDANKVFHPSPFCPKGWNSSPLLVPVLQSRIIHRIKN